jgi:hypothetical protein
MIVNSFSYAVTCASSSVSDLPYIATYASVRHMHTNLHHLLSHDTHTHTHTHTLTHT